MYRLGRSRWSVFVRKDLKLSENVGFYYEYSNVNAFQCKIYSKNNELIFDVIWDVLGFSYY